MSAQEIRIPDGPVSAEQTALDLDTARELARAGIPIFLARPALDATGRWVPDGGHHGCGYWLPKRWQQTVADPAVLDRWRPGMAVATVTGHGLDAADVDPRHGGDVTRSGLVVAGMWPRVYAEAATPSGGTHELVAALDAASKDALRDGLDVKAGRRDTDTGRGFIFIAPTVKLSKVDGEIRPYVWTRRPELELWAEERDTDDTGRALAEMVHASRTSSQASKAEAEAYDGPPFTELPVPEQDAIRRWLAGAVEGVQAELRDSASWAEKHVDRYKRGWERLQADAAYRLARLARASWSSLTLAEAEAAFTEAAPTCATWTREDVAAKWKSQEQRGTPATYPKLRVDDLSWVDGRVDLVTGEVLEAPQDGSGAPQDDPGERARRLFPRLDWHALWDDDDEEEWIHEPLLAVRRLVSLYSAPKVGKSLLMLELAVGISRGEAVLGYTPTRRWRVLYVDFENDPRGDVRSRLQAMGYGPDDLDHIDYLSFPTMAGLDSERGGLELLEAVRAYGSEVVVIDTVSRAVDGEENSNDTWLGLYRHTGLKLKQAGVAAIRLDHSGKDESKGTRGGSAKSGDVDAIWRLTRVTDERFRLECTESRMQLDTKSLQLTRHRLPRLHHTVDVLSGVTDREAKVLHLLDLAGANGLAVDANREAIRELAKTRGIGVRNDVLAEVVKRRKLSPTLGDSSSGMALSPAAGTAGTAGHSNPHSEHETTCPQPPGTAGDNTHRPHLSPGQQYLTAPVGTAGQADLAETLEELGGACSTCSRFICICEATA